MLSTAYSMNNTEFSLLWYTHKYMGLDIHTHTHTHTHTHKIHGFGYPQLHATSTYLLQHFDSSRSYLVKLFFSFSDVHVAVHRTLNMLHWKTASDIVNNDWQHTHVKLARLSNWTLMINWYRRQAAFSITNLSQLPCGPALRNCVRTKIKIFFLAIKIDVGRDQKCTISLGWPNEQFS